MRQAAAFRAQARRAGVPTADLQALDADCILAAQASLLGDPGDVVTIATTNVRQLGRFPGIQVQDWRSMLQLGAIQMRFTGRRRTPGRGRAARHARGCCA